MNNNLNFSFEVTAGAVQERDDGVFVIDRDDKNFLDGMCVVSFPACEDASAKKLVAEINSYSRSDKEAEDMPKKKMAIAEAEAETKEVEVTAETQEEEKPEVEVVAETEETAGTETAEV